VENRRDGEVGGAGEVENEWSMVGGWGWCRDGKW